VNSFQSFLTGAFSLPTHWGWGLTVMLPVSMFCNVRLKSGVSDTDSVSTFSLRFIEVVGGRVHEEGIQGVGVSGLFNAHHVILVSGLILFITDQTVTKA